MMLGTGFSARHVKAVEMGAAEASTNRRTYLAQTVTTIGLDLANSIFPGPWHRYETPSCVGVSSETVAVFDQHRNSCLRALSVAQTPGDGRYCAGTHSMASYMAAPPA